MTLNTTTCPNCGANISVKNSDSETICRHCGTTFGNENKPKEANIAANNTAETKHKKHHKWLRWIVGIICAAAVTILIFTTA